MEFLVIRLGKDSVSDIKKLDSIKNGLEQPFSFSSNANKLKRRSLPHSRIISVYIVLFILALITTKELRQLGLRELGQSQNLKRWMAGMIFSRNVS
ncbi:hypothetical protein NL418_023890 [Escherichia coli]|nr:hypothetical protein [Escherichia coli]WCQ53248.1 hypothetical protein NL418_023890 [Escherichia coli]